MNILAIETSSEACSVALLASGKQKHTNTEIKSLHHTASRQQTRVILPMINQLLNSSSLSIKDLNAVTYGCGPGSFTGVRIASSVAQGIGFSLDIPLIPISSLAIMAQTAFLDTGCRTLLVAVDARMQQIYWAVYNVNQFDRVEVMNEEKVGDLGDIVPVLTKTESIGIGSGWQAYEKRLIAKIGFKPDKINSTQAIRASAMIELAQFKLKKGLTIRAEHALPFYDNFVGAHSQPELPRGGGKDNFLG